MKNSDKKNLLLVCLIVFVSSCAVSPQNRVRQGDSPKFRDKDVAFRTTYYFRVFDYCEINKDNKDLKIPKSDALYRFKMTGKADTLFNTIKFESGHLKSSQIDPFAAQVVYDKNIKRHRFVSEQETEIQVAYHQSRKLIDDLKMLKKELKDDDIIFNAAAISEINDLILKVIKDIGRQYGLDTTTATADSNIKLKVISKNINTAVNTVFEKMDKAKSLKTDLLNTTNPEEKKLVDFVNDIAKLKKSDVENNISSLNTSIDNLKSKIDELNKEFNISSQSKQALALATNKSTINCPETAPTQRGFQILGPEGWRTFDQDDRLILAMTTSSSPLISTMKELSNRVLNAQPTPEVELLPLVREQLRISNTRRMMDRGKLSIKPSEISENTFLSLAKKVCEILIGSEQKDQCKQGDDE